MRILALDVATRTGWALGSLPGVAPESGFQNFANARGESPGMRFLRFSRWIKEMTVLSNGENAIDLVVYEQPQMIRSGPAADVLFGFSTRVMEQCSRRAIEYQPVPITALKKWVTGRGNANKEAMINAVQKRWVQDRVLADDNEADAIALYYYAREKFDGE